MKSCLHVIVVHDAIAVGKNQPGSYHQGNGAGFGTHQQVLSNGCYQGVVERSYIASGSHKQRQAVGIVESIDGFLVEHHFFRKSSETSMTGIIPDEVALREFVLKGQVQFGVSTARWITLLLISIQVKLIGKKNGRGGMNGLTEQFGILQMQVVVFIIRHQADFISPRPQCSRLVVSYDLVNHGRGFFQIRSR